MFLSFSVKGRSSDSCCQREPGGVLLAHGTFLSEETLVSSSLWTYSGNLRYEFSGHFTVVAGH